MSILFKTAFKTHDSSNITFVHSSFLEENKGVHLNLPYFSALLKQAIKFVFELLGWLLNKYGYYVFKLKVKK